MKHLKAAFILIIFALSFSEISAQNFKAGLFAGPVFTQYYNDNLSGYNKLGPKAGIFVKRQTRSEVDYNIELYYIQKGSYDAENRDDPYYFKLQLQYIEMPVLIDYRPDNINIPGLFNWNTENKVGFETGPGIAYLLKHEMEGIRGELETGREFNKFDLTANIGMKYAFNEHWSANFRFSFSIIPVRKNPGGQTFLFNRGEHNNVLQTSLYYEF